MNNIYNERLKSASKCLDENNIDLWLIYANEGSDPSVSFMTGMKTIGRTFFLITRNGKRYSIASLIDAQESEDSGYFDEVYKYSSNCEETLSNLLLKINPNKIAINYSKDDWFFDGLTAGRYRWLMNILGDEYRNRTVSSKQYIEKIKNS